MNSHPKQRAQLRVGRLTKPHGLKGAIKLELFTDSPELRFVPGAMFSLQVPTTSPWYDKTITLRELRWFNTQPVGFFEGIDDRTAAESLVKAILWIDDDSDTHVEEDAWYPHQLVGLDVVRDGVAIGSITRVDHMPAQDILAITTAAGEVLVPFVKDIVPIVDVAARRVVVTPPLGLFESSDGHDDVNATDGGQDESDERASHKRGPEAHD